MTSCADYLYPVIGELLPPLKGVGFFRVSTSFEIACLLLAVGRGDFSTWARSKPVSSFSIFIAALRSLSFIIPHIRSPCVEYSNDNIYFLNLDSVISFSLLSYTYLHLFLSLSSILKNHQRLRISLRTVQRALKTLVTYGSVLKSTDRYSITETGKRELKFRQFTQSYGTMSLNGLMDLNFPTLNTLDKNLDKLVQIFGIYVVNVLIETTRLIVTNKSSSEEHWSYYFEDASNSKDGKFREGQLYRLT